MPGKVSGQAHLRRWFKISSALPMLALAGTGVVAHAEEPAQGEDITVTARKRLETLLDVPVILTAISGSEISQRGIASLDTIARLVPQLIVSEGGGTLQGGNVILRGITAADGNSFSDQAVSFNIDGVQVARASVRRMSEMDLAQVEVYKGPQALFYGKSSPGGVIAIRTADPTASFTGKVAASYEFNARERRLDGFLSGPLTDNLGWRIAASGAKMRGWAKSDVPNAAPLAPDDKWGPKSEDFAVRGTLKWEPTAAFDARLKVSYGDVRNSGAMAAFGLVGCSGATPQWGGVGDCKPNDRISRGDIAPIFTQFDPRFGNGEPFLHQQQGLVGLEMNYKLPNNLTLSSVSGYYGLRVNARDNYGSYYTPERQIAGLNSVNLDEFSQELRLNSAFDGPLNFTVGGFYQHTRADFASHSYLNATSPTFLNNIVLKQNGDAYSVFAQARYKFLPQIELDVGGRYSHESKSLPTVLAGSAASLQPVPVTTLVDHASWNDFSPEVTLSWRPTRNLNLFGSYKEGFLSGGFNGASQNVRANLSYDQQSISGFEGGVKAELFDRALRLNFAVYDYRLKGLQITVTTNAIPTVTNAGKVKISGAEFDFSYATPIEGLSLNGAIAYLRGRNQVYLIDCYRGQTQARGCNVGVPNINGLYTQQDLAGTQLGRAPEWTGNGGFSYDRTVTAGLGLGVWSSASYSSSYLTNAVSSPGGRQPKYALLDAGLRLHAPDQSWEVGLIGRNLTNRFYFSRTADAPGTGTVPGGLAGTLGDTVGAISRGREIQLRVTKTF